MADEQFEINSSFTKPTINERWGEEERQTKRGGGWGRGWGGQRKERKNQ